MPATAMCPACRHDGHGARATAASASISTTTPAYRTSRNVSGSACGAASRATTNPDDQIRTNRNGVARTARKAPDGEVLGREAPDAEDEVPDDEEAEEVAMDRH
ncbi:hypothetical protein PSD17_44250 [Pseudonocardia sp. D17]|nr:hypothetical protein PSD17_44250 [Pseudonocardia sp. D17]